MSFHDQLHSRSSKMKERTLPIHGRKLRLQPLAIPAELFSLSDGTP